MQIQVSETPNSLAKKFIISGAGDKPFGPHDELHVNYQNTLTPFGENRGLPDASRECALASELLKAGVFSVMFDQGSEGSFVTIGVKEQDKPLWDAYQEAATAILTAYLEDSGYVFSESFQPVETQGLYHKRVLYFFREQHGQQAVDVVEPILTAIQALSPYVKADGGNLKFKSINFETGEVFVEMTGACTGCSKTGDTLGNVQEAIRENFGLNITMVNIAKTEQPAVKFDDFVIG